MKFLILLLAFTLTLSQETNIKFLENGETKIIPNALIEGIEKLIENTEENLQGIFPTACLNELKSLKSIITTIKNSKGTDEIIFNAAKDLVNHFPGLSAQCHIPLPIIDTSKWDFEKFKKYHCAISAFSFATSAAACLDGGIFACGKAILGLIEVAKCLKDLI